MKPMSIEALRHLRSGGRVRYEGDKETFLEPEPTGPTVADLIAQGYLSPTGLRKTGMPPEMAMPYGVDALDVRLKIYQGVAIIGWVAAILLALGV